MQILPGRKPAKVALRAAILEARLLGAALAPIEVNIREVVEQAVFGLDVDYSRGTQSELRGQRAGQQADAVGEARTQNLAESCDSFRKLDPIDAILQVGVVAADMDLSEGILRDTRRLQQYLIELRILTLRQILYRLLAESIDAATGFR